MMGEGEGEGVNSQGLVACVAGGFVCVLNQIEPEL